MAARLGAAYICARNRDRNESRDKGAIEIAKMLDRVLEGRQRSTAHCYLTADSDLRPASEMNAAIMPI
jgi:hypothetical protein